MVTMDRADFIAVNLQDINGLLFESAAEGLLVIDQDGTIRMVNPRICELFGYSRHELIGEKVELLIPDALRSGHTHHREKYFMAPKRRSMGIQLDLSARTKDGSIFPVEISLNHFNVQGQILAMALITDVTEKKKIIDQLKKEKETARMYLEMAGSMFVLIDAQGEIKLINQQGCEILGYDEAEILAKNWLDTFIPVEQKSKIKNIFKELLDKNNGAVLYHVSPVLTSDGIERVISWNSNLVKDANGQITGILSSGQDITDRVVAENRLKNLNAELEERVRLRTLELQNSQQLYKLIARNFPNGVISVLDTNLDYVFVEGMEMYKRGITSDMLVGTSFLDHVDESTRVNVRNTLKSALSGQNSSFELKSGSQTHMINAVGLYSKDEKIDQVLVVSQNITNQKNAEENIQRSLEKEIRLNELKSRFVSMASHEFRTPLTTVMNSNALLGKYIGTKGNEDKQHKHVNRVEKSISQLANILNEFLSLDKLDEGKVIFHRREIHLPTFIHELIDDLSGIIKSGQQVDYKHSGEEHIQVDRQMLTHIFNNLLMNAIKFSSENSIVCIETHIDDKLLTAKIRDNGIGIPKDEQHHLFERFFRAKNVINIPGTGLGLNIVKKYLDMIGGEIRFVSKLTQGTMFKITIPVHMPK